MIYGRLWLADSLAVMGCNEVWWLGYKFGGEFLSSVRQVPLQAVTFLHSVSFVKSLCIFYAFCWFRWSVCPCGCVRACVGRGLTAARCHSSPPRCSARGNVCVLSHAFLFTILMHDGNKEREYESWTRRTELCCIFYKKKQKCTMEESQ